jgi:hypothetical protein
MLENILFGQGVSGEDVFFVNNQLVEELVMEISVNWLDSWSNWLDKV